MILPMNGYDDENDNWEYEIDIELPYGTFSSEILFDVKPLPNQPVSDDAEDNKKPILESELKGVFEYYEPKPISLEE